PPFPDVVPLLQEQIDVTRPESDPFFWYGWSPAEQQFRWTDGYEATLVFVMEHPGDTQLTMRVVGFIVPGRPRQRVTVALNATPLGKFEIADNLAREYTIQLPASALRDRNVVTFT